MVRYWSSTSSSTSTLRRVIKPKFETNICEEHTKSGLRCTSKIKLTRDDGKKVCGRHKK